MRACADGSRVNAIIPPLALDGPSLSIRRFRTDRARRRRPGRARDADAADARFPSRRRGVPAQHHRVGRHRRRQDDASQRAVGLHLEPRARRHHRGRRRADAAAAARRPARNAPAQHRGQGRGPPARARHQRAAYAPRPHHRRRGPRRRGARHAAGHEHRPRRQPHDHPRQQPARRALPSRHDGGHGQPESSRSAPSASRSRRRSTWSSRSRGYRTARGR